MSYIWSILIIVSIIFSLLNGNVFEINNVILTTSFEALKTFGFKVAEIDNALAKITDDNIEVNDLIIKALHLIYFIFNKFYRLIWYNRLVRYIFDDCPHYLRSLLKEVFFYI